MPDLGSIGVSVGSIDDPRSSLGLTGYPRIYRGIRLPGGTSPTSEWLSPGGKLDTDGEPSPPCFNVLMGGIFRFKFPVGPGVRGVSIRARELSTLVPRPKFRVLKNPTMGISSTLEATAPSGSGWFTLGPLTFTAPAAGVITVELVSFNGDNGHGDCRWDTIAIS